MPNLRVAIVFIFAFAGCISDQKVVVSAEEATDQAHVRLNARLLDSLAIGGNIDAGDWFAMTTQSGPAGAFSVYELPIPPGTVAERIDGGGASLWDVVTFMVDPSASPVETWALLVFETGSGEGRLMDWAFRTTLTVTEFGPFAAPERTIQPSLGGRVDLISGEGIQDGARLVVAVAANSPEASEFGIIVRPHLAEDDNMTRQVDLSAFLSSAAGSEGRVPTLRGNGVGFQIADYFSLSGVVGGDAPAPAPVASVAQFTSNVKVENTLPGDGALLMTDTRQTSLSSDFDGEQGWSFVQIRCGSSTADAGKWSATVKLHDLSETRESIHLAGNLAASSSIFGYPGLNAVAEGNGSSEAAFDVTLAASAGNALAYRHVWLGTPLGTLLGLEMMEGVTSAEGELGGFPLPEHSSE